MPEMFGHCGQRLKVFKRAHKTCDPPNGIGGRRMEAAVHLEGVRCDGSAHGDCQAGCLVFWKEAWLKAVDDPDVSVAEVASSPGASKANVNSRCSERHVRSATSTHDAREAADGPTYSCQSTKLAQATLPLRWWDPRQYAEDYLSGNVRLPQMLAALTFSIYHGIASGGFGVGSAMRSAYDAFQRLRGGTPYPWRLGQVEKGQQTPSGRLHLQVGEWVRVKSHREILQTLDEDSRNRGMYFDAEEVPYCGGTYRVRDRVHRIIDEKTGKMLGLKNPAIVLDDVVCQARYSKCRRFCPRSIYPFWREIWLERISGPNQ
jgi:hypothetical protein